MKAWSLATTAAALLGCALLPRAFGFPFEINEDVRGAWNTTVAAGAGIRLDNPRGQWVGAGNANQSAGAYAAVNTADDGNLNFRRGDVVSAPITLLSDLELRYRNQFGGFARVRAWYDTQLSQQGVPHGHVPNSYVPGARLDDSGFYAPSRFSGIELLDAFVYGNVDLGDRRLAVRLGQQSINWGESLLYLGLNGFNPVNFSALGRPGARLEEALIPVNRLWAALPVAPGWSVEGFYTLDWKRSNLPGCGTFTSLADNVFHPGCNFTVASVPLPDRVTYGLGAGIPTLTELPTRSAGQWGLATRYFAEALSTEFGLYYVRYNSPNPNVNINVGNNQPSSSMQATHLEGVQSLALSAATGMRNVALSAELSHTTGLGGQRNLPTMLEGVAGSGPYAAQVAAGGPGSVLAGGLPLNRTQLQFGGSADVSPLVGPYDASVTAEAMLQWTSNLPGLETERIGRNPNLGTAGWNGVCAGGLNLCSTEGFATQFSWGYRILARASLPQPALGLVLQPMLLFAHDVQGYSFDNTLVQGRYIIGPVLRAVYQRQYFAELGAVLIRGNSDINYLRDRSTFTFAVGMAI